MPSPWLTISAGSGGSARPAAGWRRTRWKARCHIRDDSGVAEALLKDTGTSSAAVVADQELEETTRHEAARLPTREVAAQLRELARTFHGAAVDGPFHGARAVRGARGGLLCRDIEATAPAVRHLLFDVDPRTGSASATRPPSWAAAGARRLRPRCGGRRGEPPAGRAAGASPTGRCCGGASACPDGRLARGRVSARRRRRGHGGRSQRRRRMSAGVLATFALCRALSPPRPANRPAPLSCLPTRRCSIC